MASLADRALTWIIERRQMRLPEPAEPNPYLAGPFAPVDREVIATDLPVAGVLPPQLDGLYARIGPNPVAPPNPAAYHWFIGDGMVHGIRIEQGRALWYRNRWVRSTEVSQALGEPPVSGPRHGNFDTVNTNVIGHAGRIFALVEAGAHPVELSPELATLAHSDFSGTLKGGFTAHPHRDPETGELHAVCYDARQLNQVRYVVVGADGRVRRDVAVPVRHGPSIHDCAISERHAIVLDLPVTFSLRTLLAGHAFPYRWNPKHLARVGLLPREGRADEIVWCAVDPCYVFHTCNAFDLPDGRVVLDVVVHDRMFHESHWGPDSQRIGFERWTCDPTKRTVERAVIDEAPQEFPRFDERRTGRPYRYAYTVAIEHPEAAPSAPPNGAVYKHDLATGERTLHDFGRGRIAGEFVFVPEGSDAGEDEGWLMGLVTDTGRAATDLVVLDARDVAAPPVAMVALPQRAPLGFHGNWIARHGS